SRRRQVGARLDLALHGAVADLCLALARADLFRDLFALPRVDHVVDRAGLSFSRDDCHHSLTFGCRGNVSSHASSSLRLKRGSRSEMKCAGKDPARTSCITTFGVRHKNSAASLSVSTSRTV